MGDAGSITSVEVLYSVGHILGMVPGKRHSAESKSSPESTCIVDVVVTKSRTPEPRSRGSGKTFLR